MNAFSALTFESFVSRVVLNYASCFSIFEKLWRFMHDLELPFRGLAKVECLLQGMNG